MKMNFWRCIKQISKLFDFTVTITFTDAKITDFDIKYVESEVSEDEA